MKGEKLNGAMVYGAQVDSMTYGESGLKLASSFTRLCQFQILQPFTSIFEKIGQLQWGSNHIY